MIKLHLTRTDDYEGVYLQLPASPAEIGEVWSWLDGISDDVASTRIVGAISNVWNIGQYLKNADVNNPDQNKKLNRIAEIIGILDRNECRLFEGALNTESVNSLDDVIAIGERLDQYLFIPHVITDRELGMCLVNYGIMPFDEHVQPYLDYSRIGIEYYANHGGAYTAGGYVVRRDSVEQALIDAVQDHDHQEIGGMRMG
jgi:hypothetical protein